MSRHRYQYLVTVRGSRPFPHVVLKEVVGDFATLGDQQTADFSVTRTIKVAANHVEEHYWRAHGAEISMIERLA